MVFLISCSYGIKENLDDSVCYLNENSIIHVSGNATKEKTML